MKGQKKKILAITLVLMAFVAVGIKGTVGSEDDPLISLSYIQNVLMPYIDEVAAGGASQEFTVVELNDGQKLIAHGGSEIILRSGTAVISIPKGASGGFTDVTAGADVVNGDKAEANHLLICPRSDGRKLKANSKVYLMVRGSWEIE